MAVEVGEGFGVVGDHGIEIEGLRVGEVGVGDRSGDGGPVGGEPAAEAVGVVASAEVVVEGFGVALLALEFVVVSCWAIVGVCRAFDAEGIFSDLFMISAETGDGVEDLARTLAGRMPEGPWHYPADQLSDLPLRLLAAETTREHLFRQLHDELPYELAVEPESWEDFKDGSVRVAQVIYVQRENQKPIVLGRGGQRIKAVRSAAQRELEALLDRKVHLFPHVKVRADWADDPGRFRDLGLEYDV